MNRYRIAYLGTAAVLMGGAVFVAAESAAPGRGSRFNFSAFLDQKRADAGAGAEIERPEPGNLSEAGAKELLNQGDYLAALVASRETPVIIFKHSTSCEVSGAAYRRTAEWMKSSAETRPPVFLVKVIENKPVSQLIEKQTHVKHESPQVILLHGGKAVWTASHEDITADALNEELAKLAPPDSQNAETD